MALFLSGRLEDILAQEKKKVGMLLIDVQEGLLSAENDSIANTKIKRMRELLLFGRANNYPLYTIELDPDEAGRTIPYLQNVLTGYSLARCITKNGPSAFRRTTLKQDLQDDQVKALVLMGLSMNYCVLDSARDARKHGFDVITSPSVMIGGLGGIDPFYLQHCRLYDDELQQVTSPASERLSII